MVATHREHMQQKHKGLFEVNSYTNVPLRTYVKKKNQKPKAIFDKNKKNE